MKLLHRPVFPALLAASCLALTPLSAGTPEENLAKLGQELPSPSTAVANYVPVVRSGSLLFLAGHIPRTADNTVVTGKVGDTISEAEATEAARLAGLALLSTVRAELGSLDRVKRIVRVSGFVNATPDYERHSFVINGCSDLLVAVFGEKGRHARSAIGAGSLPLNAAVEIELVVEVD